MTGFAGAIEAEVLRLAYALSSRRWPALLVEAAVAALIVTFALATWRLRRPITSREES